MAEPKTIRDFVWFEHIEEPGSAYCSQIAAEVVCNGKAFRFGAAYREGQRESARQKVISNLLGRIKRQRDE